MREKFSIFNYSNFAFCFLLFAAPQALSDELSELEEEFQKTKEAESFNDVIIKDVIVKDKEGRPIGFEMIGFSPKELDPLKYFKEQSLRFLSAAS